MPALAGGRYIGVFVDTRPWIVASLKASIKKSTNSLTLRGPPRPGRRANLATAPVDCPSRAAAEKLPASTTLIKVLMRVKSSMAYSVRRGPEGVRRRV
jgi:hypothetical protein